MRSTRGFSLVEALVATAMMAVGIAGLAQLFVVAIGANERAKHITRAAIFAQQKMEELRANGDPTPSPPDALDRNVPGFFDLVAASGLPPDAAAGPPRTAVYIRRWRVGPLAADPAGTLVLQVRVTQATGGGDVRLASLMARRIS